MRLDPQAVSTGVRLATYDEIASTNAEALVRAAAGERGPLWIVARRQTAGRGRHGRPWVSEPGNLYATLLVSDAAPAGRAPEISFAAALAVHDAVADVAPALRERLTLKWPNDLLCDGKKLAGILIEGQGQALAIGIGLDCRHHPDGTSYPATDLAALGVDVSAEDAFAALSRSTLVRLAQWGRGAGFAAIRADWLQRAHGRGRDVRVRLDGRDTEGRFEDLDAAGRLLLRHADGSLETISAGDVFPLRSLTAITD
jgi:BirA family biotin operon repressor/biotin-[acetyl-CoA-carboxylase] ligase